MLKLYLYIAISLLCSVIGFFAGLLWIPESWIAVANVILIVFLVVSLLFAFIMKLVKKKASNSIRFPISVVYLFAFIDGALIYPALMYYLESLGALLFAEVVIGTMVIFGILAFIGQKSQSGSFDGLGKILLVLLTVMVIVSVANIFMQIDLLSTILSAVGILFFSLYILVDVNQFKVAYESGYIHDSSDYSVYVLNIYLDIFNLLLDILDFLDLP